MREPLKPRAPADDQLITFPVTSVIVIMVLLNVALMCTTPAAMFFLTRFFPFFGVTGEAVTGSIPPRFGAAGGAASSVLAGASVPAGFFVCFSSATLDLRVLRSHYAFGAGAAVALRTRPRFGPLRVRALVWVRWPRAGRPLRWRRPR